MKNKNILELCLSDGLGGLELFAASCYKSFSKHTSCKLVISPNQKLDNYLEDEEKYYINRNKIFPIFPAIKLAKFIDKNDIDIIHFHWTRDIITAVLAKLISKKKPKLVQSRHMNITRFKNDIYHRWLYKNIDMIHAVTNKLNEDIKKYVPSEVIPKIEMIYLGTKVPDINKQKLEQLSKQYKINDEFIVGIVGRIEEEKGQYKLIEAINKLKLLNIKAIIVGSAMDEEYFESLRTKVEYYNLSDKIIFAGFSKDVNEYMQLFDVNILATSNETFGLVIIEAMANKTTVITTNKGGPLEIIEDKINGLLFDGSIDDLANKIEQLYKDRNLKLQLSNAGYQTVIKKFNKDIQLMELYNAITKI